MQAIDTLIMRDIEQDGAIRVKGLAVDVRRKSLFGHRKVLRVAGTVRTAIERDKVLRIAEHHCGNSYDVLDDMTIKEEQATNA